MKKCNVPHGHFRVKNQSVMSQGNTCITSMKIKRSLKLEKHDFFYPLYSEGGSKSSLIVTAVFTSVSGPNSLLEFTVTCWSCIMTDLLIYWLRMVKMYPLTGKNILIVNVLFQLFFFCACVGVVFTPCSGFFSSKHFLR